ncbi:MAG: hypothetical protein ACI9AQ_002909, partial [Dinoroseobacter sp.]
GEAMHSARPSNAAFPFDLGKNPYIERSNPCTPENPHVCDRADYSRCHDHSA